VLRCVTFCIPGPSNCDVPDAGVACLYAPVGSLLRRDGPGCPEVWSPTLVGLDAYEPAQTDYESA
jgi:hypothetical protein